MSGRIVRVEVHDFVTFSHGILHSGDYLNLIVGPNGTGKSTMISAICLGLGGKTSLLGRARDIKDFIKYNCQRAIIEVELSNVTGRNYCIKRVIDNNKSTSSWMLNGRSVPKDEITHLVSRLNIQMDNLCQFLPQDRVQEFSGLKDTERLDATLKGIDQKLYSMYNDLKKESKVRSDLENNHATNRKLLTSYENRLSQLQPDLEMLHNREECEKTVKNLQIKADVVNHKVELESLESLKARRHELSRIVNELRKERDERERKIQKVKEDLVVVKSKLNTQNCDLKIKSDHFTKVVNEIKTLSDSREQLFAEFNNKKSDEKKRLDTIRTWRLQIEQFKEEIKNVLPNERLDNEISTIASSIETLVRKKARLDSEIIENQTYSVQDQRKLNELKEVQNRLNNVTNQKLEILRRTNHDAYDACMWLKQNRALFNRPVYESMMINLNVKDPTMAKYVEHRIHSRDLFAFLFETKEDLQTFVKEMNKINNRTAALVMPKRQLSSFKRMPIERFANKGFRNWLIDLVSGPEGILSYLCESYHFHEIPVGTARVDDCLEQIVAQTDFQIFFSESTVYSCIKSRYQKNKSTSTSECRNANLLALSRDDDALSKNKNDIEATLILSTERNKKLATLKESQQKITDERTKLEEEKSSLEQRRSKYRTLNYKIEHKEDAIRQKQAAAIDMRQEKRNFVQKDVSIAKTKVDKILSLKNIMDQLMDLHSIRVRLSFEAQYLTKRVSDFDNENHANTLNLETKENEFKKIYNDMISKREKVQELWSDILKKCKLPRNTEVLPDTFSKLFIRFPDSLDELNTRIAEENSRLTTMYPVNESITKEAKDLEVKIDQLKEKTNSSCQSLTDKENDLKEMKKVWLNPLKKLINQINSNFSAFMQNLKCAGEVSLSHNENQMDVENFGISIKVQFRSQSQMCELSRNYQSGGERAVATMLYLLALQELNKVPFRIVDEINQGMDNENERKVFDMIVKTVTTLKQSSQYFLVSPKLLGNLRYPETMVVHCIFNGPFVLEQKLFNLNSINRQRESFTYAQDPEANC